MENSPFYYKDICLDLDNDSNKIELLQPYKVELKENIECNFLQELKCSSSSIHVSDILYNNKPLYIQTPKSKLISINGVNLKVNLNKHGSFLNLFQKLNEKLKQCVYINSKKLFNGKQFTENKINNSYQSNINVNEKEFILDVHLSKDVKIFNTFMESISEEIKSTKEELLNKNVTCILHVKNIIFTKTTIHTFISIEHIKIYNEKIYPRTCLFVEKESSICTGNSNDTDDHKDEYKEEDLFKQETVVDEDTTFFE
jgi:hypothetical protein